MLNKQNKNHIMAEFSEKKQSNDNVDDFCKNFDATSCRHCNGFYGPNRGQPLCVLCHQFLFSHQSRKRRYYSLAAGSAFKFGSVACSSDEVDRPRVSASKRVQLKDLSKFFSEGHKHAQSENAAVKANIGSCSKSTIPKSEVNSKIKPEANTKVIPEVKSDTHISVLPVEMLSKVFSYLNTDALLKVSKVSQHWQRILDARQEFWKNLTTKRWPLLQRKTETKSWLKIYTALESSCFCGICVNEMREKTDDSERGTLRRRLERDRMARFEVGGIRSVPLDESLSHWHASIAGPADSVYSGGTFFLYIYMPSSYPFKPPIFKFLTKIIHPNISRHGDIGLDIITSTYNLALSLNKMLLSIQSLLCDPYTMVCMEPELGRLYDADRPRFDALARDWTNKYAMMDQITFDT